MKAIKIVISQFKELFREPYDNEGMAEYVIPRAIMYCLLFCLLIMILCVIGTYLPTEPLI